MTEEIDVRALRNALGQFATGVTIVTTAEPDGRPRGFTANSFASVSLEPPLLLVCIAKSAASRAVFCAAPRFAINVLTETQKELSGLFASQRPDKFEQASWRAGRGGVPLIDGALAWFECERHDEVEAGDHVILIGRAVDFGSRDGQPLGFLRGSYFTLGVEDRLVEAAVRGAASVVGAILERDGEVLLSLDPAGEALAVPAVGRDDGPASLKRLKAALGGQDGTAEIDFVYAVVEERGGTSSIYYRGRVTGEAPSGMAYVPLDGRPWERIGDAACRTMLRRYAEERAQGSFAVYMGDETAGVVRSVG